MNHIRDEEIIKYYKHDLDVKKEICLLTHIAECTTCAQKFAELFPKEEMIVPSKNLKREIMDQTVNQKQQTENSFEIINFSKERKKKKEWFLYSAKVVVAASIALFMIVNIEIGQGLQIDKNAMQISGQMENKTSVSKILQQSTAKLGNGLKRLSGTVSENMVFEKEKSRYEKTEK